MSTDPQETANQLSVHEAVCAERYLGINARLKRIEQILLGALGAIIVALGTIAWGVIKH